MIQRARPLLGTLVEIRAEAAPHAVSLAFDAIARVHALMSFQDPQSELSRLNSRAAFEPVQVHPWTWRVLRAACWMHDHSGGAFDCRVATPARSGEVRTGFDAGRLAGPARLDCGVELLSRRRVRFKQAQMQMDLSGIAKGFAVDRAIGVLRRHGSRALVNAGGDLRVIGDIEEPIAVRDPRLPQQLLPLGLLGGGAIATSAPYFSSEGEGWAVRDPSSGRSPQRYRSVSVLAPTCLRADALTKVVWVAGLESARPLLKRLRAEAVVL